jgi:hypothetical protein
VLSTIPVHLSKNAYALPAEIGHAGTSRTKDQP